jgi:hypothetical protein
MNDAERREGSGSPPTVIMRAYQGMDDYLKQKLQKIGLGMVIVGIGAPMGIEPFIPLSWIYWFFAGCVVILGACLLWPPIGIWFGNFVVSFVTKVRPSTKDVLMPDRRGDP